MITRLASVETDREQLLAGAHNFVSRMGFTKFFDGEDADYLDEVFLNVMSDPNVEITVAEDNGVIVAGIGMHYSVFMWNPRMIQAAELFWWADASHASAALRVLRSAAKSAVRPGFDGKTVLAFRKLSSSPDKVAGVYARMGLFELETSYVGVV